MPYELTIGSKAPPFTLAATDGKVYTLDSFEKSAILVLFFTCNHCPYVIGSEEGVAHLANSYNTNRVQFIGINSNSIEHHETDSFYHMVQRMNGKQFPWIYLYDPTQEIAQAYRAIKTPQFYLLNQSRTLEYCGRAFDNPKNWKKSVTEELKEAIDALLNGESSKIARTEPIGCTIKWRGKEKHWIPNDLSCDFIP